MISVSSPGDLRTQKAVKELESPMNADERRLKTREVIRVPWCSSAALTGCFTSSNLLLILSIIGKVPAKARRARNTRAKVA